MHIPLISKLQGGENTLVVDVGSGSIAVAVVEARSSAPSIVHISEREAISHAERSESQLVNALVEQTRSVSQKVLSAYTERQDEIGVIENTLVVVHAPWVSSRTFKAEAPLVERMEVVPEMIGQLTEKALPQDDEPPAGEIFEQSVVRVELNGYPTARPEGKWAQTVGAVVLESSANQQLLNGIRDVLEQKLPGREVLFRSATLVDTFLLRAYMSRVQHFTIADVTSEATSFTIVQFGSIVGMNTVRIGTRTITRRAAQEKTSSTEDIESNMRMITAGECNDKICQEFFELLSSVAGKCTTEFGKMFEEMAQEYRLPNTLILRAHPAFVQWFSEFLARVDFAQFTQTTRPFHIIPITSADFSEYSIFAAGVAHDVGIATAGAFVHNKHIVDAGVLN